MTTPPLFSLRFITLVSALLATPLVYAATKTAPPVITAGQLTYGTAATFSPFEFQANGKLTGFDIDLIEALGKKLALQPTAMNMEFQGLIPALQGKRVDLINSAMYMNAARAAQVDFVPYLRIGNQVVVTQDNPAKITGRDNSLCGKTVAVTLGAIEETYARQDDQRCRDAGLQPVKVQTLPTAQASALSLRQGRADAIFDSTPGVVQMLREVPDVFKTVGPEFESETQIGMAVTKGNTAMSAALQGALKELVADGTYKQIIEKWKFPETVSLFD
ncbi:ABC transporter substrate-binding protein [Pseudomonas sp.]|uniref:ABC transporter substrate-binding protein n=1 Tax=Pseudomonas sp. TaxID=306 RepID=UPI0026255A19|nr:ABC transporter substrate-binding protein [Pseudomonas sp.]